MPGEDAGGSSGGAPVGVPVANVAPCKGRAICTLKGPTEQSVNYHVLIRLRNLANHQEE